MTGYTIIGEIKGSLLVTCPHHPNGVWRRKPLRSQGCSKCLGERNKLNQSHLYKSLVNRFHNIKRRCYKETDKTYPNYGGKGIQLSEEFHDREIFIQYCLSLPNVLINKELDRIDNTGNYERGNLRWVDRYGQQLNTDRTHLIEWQGNCYTFHQFVIKFTKIPKTTARSYYLDKGYTPEQLIELSREKYEKA